MGGMVSWSFKWLPVIMLIISHNQIRHWHINFWKPCMDTNDYITKFPSKKLWYILMPGHSYPIIHICWQVKYHQIAPSEQHLNCNRWHNYWLFVRSWEFLYKINLNNYSLWSLLWPDFQTGIIFTFLTKQWWQ